MAIKQEFHQIKRPVKPINFDCQNNSAIQELLNVVVSILAEEYVKTAKDNPEIFSNEK